MLELPPTHSSQTAKSVVELRKALRSDWAELRRSLDDALSCRQQCQEEMIMEYINRLQPRDPALGLLQVQPIAPATPDCHSEVGSVAGGGRRAKLQALSVNIQQIVRPSGGHPAGHDTASCSHSKAGSSECASTTLAEPVAAVVHAAVAHLEAVVQRLEHGVTRQEQLQLQRPPSARPLAACLGGRGYASEKDSYTYFSERADNMMTAAQSLSSAKCAFAAGSEGSEIGVEVAASPEDIPRSPATERQRNMSVTAIMESHSARQSQGVLHKQLRRRFSSFVTWYENLEEPPRTGWLAEVVQGRYFDSLCAFVIMFNAMFTWYTTNWEIDNLDKPPTTFMDVVEILFVIFYTVELVLKMSVHGGYFFVCSEMRWNIFDTILVVVSLCDQVLSALSTSGGGGGGANVTFMRALRILKMAKILRGLRVLRFFYELRLMLNSLIGSFNSLLWSIVMLSLIFYVFGLIFVQGASLHLFLHSEEMEPKDKELLRKEFGSVQAAMLSLFRTCTGGDDWAYFYDIVTLTGAPYAFIFVFFIAFSHIAILNILTAIFVNNAMELARPDADTLAYEHRNKEFEAYGELRQLCESITDEATGLISVEDFATQLKFGRLGARLAVLGISVSDAESFLELLLFTMDGAPTSGVRPSDFVEGCMRLRGQATGINIQSIQQETRRILRLVQQLRSEQLAKTSQLTETLQTVLECSCVPHPQLNI